MRVCFRAASAARAEAALKRTLWGAATARSGSASLARLIRWRVPEPTGQKPQTFRAIGYVFIVGRTYRSVQLPRQIRRQRRRILRRVSSNSKYITRPEKFQALRTVRNAFVIRTQGSNAHPPFRLHVLNVEVIAAVDQCHGTRSRNDDCQFEFGYHHLDLLPAAAAILSTMEATCRTRTGSPGSGAARSTPEEFSW